MSELLIKNPITGRMVKINGKIGKIIRFMREGSKPEILEKLKTNRDWIKYSTDEQRNDPDIILIITEPKLINTFETGFYMRYASAKLKSDKNFVLQAVKQNPKVFEFLGLGDTLPVPEYDMTETNYNSRSLHPDIVSAAVEADLDQENWVI